MKTLTIKKYLGEKAEELTDLLKENSIYLIGGCGCGKSYYIENYLLKEHKTLNTNFLNVLNIQNFNDWYVEGASAASRLTGEVSATINIHNLSYVSDEAIKNFEFLVIDEIQELWFSSDYRSEAGDRLKDQIRRFIAGGVKVLCMTGTPVYGVPFSKEFGLVPVKIEKTEKTPEDMYDFTFCKGLCYKNVGKYAVERMKSGKTVVILSDLYRKQIVKSLISEGVDHEIIQSPDKQRTGSATKYIVDTQELPKDVDCFITTSVLAGGVNINDVDRDIEYITFPEDIQTPHQSIQFAGRSRKQMKVLTIGYTDDKDFTLTYNHTFLTVLGDLRGSKTSMELEEALSRQFNCKDRWIEYMTGITDCNIHQTAAFIKGSEDTSDISKTDWDEYIKIIKSLKPGDRSYDDYFKPKTSVGDINVEDAPNGRTKWVSVKDTMMARNINKALDMGLPVCSGNLKEAIRVSRYVVLLKRLASRDQKGKALIDDISAGNTIGNNTFEAVYKDLFGITKTVNGKVELSNIGHDQKKYISEAYTTFIEYNNTIRSIFGANPFYKNTWGLDTVEEFNKELVAVESSKSKKKANHKGKKVFLVNTQTGEKLEFPNAGALEKYAKETLGFGGKKIKALRNSEVDGYKRES